MLGAATLIATCADTQQTCSVNGVLKECWNYVCSNGVPAAGLIDRQNHQLCSSCTTGFTKNASNLCVATVYTCANGTASTGTPGGSSDVEQCSECNSGYTLNATTTRCEQVTTVTTPDLRVTLIAQPSNVVQGVATPITITATVYNTGGASANATTLQWYRSSDATITQSDTPIGDMVTVDALAADASADYRTQIPIPATTSLGSYYYGACVEAVTTETDTADNCAATTITVTETAQSDLIVGAPTVTDGTGDALTSGSSVTPGSTLRVATSVINVGAGAAQSTTLQWHISPDNTIESTEPTVGAAIAIDALASNGSVAVAPLSLTAPTTTGSYYYGACVAIGASEIDPTNNCSSSFLIHVAQYTCENGTAKSGTPSGNTNVEECTACNPGYTINASKQCRDITGPTFSVAPALDGNPTANGATVKLTASEAGKLFWVLYLDNAPAPANAAALIAAASGSSIGVQRSGDSEVVTTTEKTLTLSQLTAGTTYTFYAVLQDSAGNNGAVSPKLEIITSITASYTCLNGTARAGGPSGVSDVEECTVCNPGYTINASKECRDITGPTFSAAPALKSGSVTGTGAEITLTASEAGKLFWVLYIDGALTTTPRATDLIQNASGNTVGEQRSGDGVAVDAATEVTVTLTSLTAGTTYDFYAVLQDSAGNNGAVSPKLEIITSITASYTCLNGTARAGGPSGVSDVEECTVCNPGYTINASKECRDITGPTFSAAPALKSGSVTGTGAEITLTASEAGKLFWVLYIDGALTTTPRATDLIQNASGNTVGEQRSGDGVAVDAATEVTVTLTSLTAGTTYDFYAVLQDSAANTSTVSDVVITTAATADKIPPTFIGGPTFGTSTDTSATVTLTASEAGKLFWVLYADGALTTAPSAAALIAAASGGSAGEQRSGASETVDAATEKTVTLTGLTASTTYDFYAVLQDSTGNNGTVSPKLEITTAATPDKTPPTFIGGPTFGTSTETTATVTLTASEAGKLFWVLYADGALTTAPSAAALIAAASGGSAGEQRSGASETVDAATEKTVTLTGLTASTTYDFYAVLQDSVGNNGVISAVVEITTPDNTAPTFSAQPAVKVGTLAPETATVTLTSDEDGKLFWVVYAEGFQVADNVALITAATADPQPGTVVARGAVVGVDVTATTQVEVAVSGLDDGTEYDFYAVVRDAATNVSALSTKLTFETPVAVSFAEDSYTFDVGTKCWRVYGDNDCDTFVTSIAANAAIGTVAATKHSSVTETIAYSISGGADETKFDIDGATGAITNNATALASLDTNTTYALEITATVGSNTDTATVRVINGETVQLALAATPFDKNSGAGVDAIQHDQSTDAGEGAGTSDNWRWINLIDGSAGWAVGVITLAENFALTDKHVLYASVRSDSTGDVKMKFENLAANATNEASGIFSADGDWKEVSWTIGPDANYDLRPIPANGLGKVVFVLQDANGGTAGLGAQIINYDEIYLR